MILYKNCEKPLTRSVQASRLMQGSASGSFLFSSNTLPYHIHLGSFLKLQPTVHLFITAKQANQSSKTVMYLVAVPRAM